MAGSAAGRRVFEYRFVADFQGDDLPAFREALVELAGGFTEIPGDRGTRYVIGLQGRDARRRLRAVLIRWSSHARAGRINLEQRSISWARDEIYFLLPLQRNPDQPGKPRLPLFTNEQFACFRDSLARDFHFRPEAVRVYGEWRNDAGRLIPDHLLLFRVPRRGRGVVHSLRRFIRRVLLSAPGCDQDYVYLSSRWRGEYVARI